MCCSAAKVQMVAVVRRCKGTGRTSCLADDALSLPSFSTASVHMRVRTLANMQYSGQAPNNYGSAALINTTEDYVQGMGMHIRDCGGKSLRAYAYAQLHKCCASDRHGL